MLLKKPGDLFDKVTPMGDVTLYEPAGDAPLQEKSNPQASGLLDCISHLQTPYGAKPVLKTMITTACERNCFYCPFRAGRGSTRRMTITPDALAGAFDTMQRAKAVDGLFLSSGIIRGGVTSQDKIIDTAEILRRKYRYRGYIHLKIMPGAERDQVQRAMQLADRISINLEAPTLERLAALAPKKEFDGELIAALRQAATIRQQDPRARASIVTQFVVGAVGDTDLELLSLSERLYRRLGLARAYYSAFHPVADTPFENIAPTHDLRQLRLYQASFLLRDYNWELEDLPLEGAGLLRTDVDPKIAWADQHLRQQPVDLMLADREQLMRVPGIGAKSADAIVLARRERALTDLHQLARIGVRTPERLAPYILLNGSVPRHQQRLF